VTTKQTIDGLKRALEIVIEDEWSHGRHPLQSQTVAALNNMIQRLEREYEKEENLELGL
jgi:hypothetical protein